MDVEHKWGAGGMAQVIDACAPNCAPIPKNDVAEMVKKAREKPESVTWAPVCTGSERPHHMTLQTAAPSRLDQFDAALQRVTQDRGAVYGHPSVDFDRVNRLKAVVAECPDSLVRHTLEMICVKIARLIETPDHLDSWVDIGGYARCGVMVTEPTDADR